jgi:hypothetical protein
MQESKAIPALSVRAPWAYAIAFAGKRIENRTWQTSYRGALFIHASSGWTLAECNAIENISGKKVPADLVRGALIARADLVDIVPLAKVRRDPWAIGPFCWLLEDVQPIAPRYMPGRLSLWYPTS